MQKVMLNRNLILLLYDVRLCTFKSFVNALGEVRCIYYTCECGFCDESKLIYLHIRPPLPKRHAIQTNSYKNIADLNLTPLPHLDMVETQTNLSWTAGVYPAGFWTAAVWTAVVWSFDLVYGEQQGGEKFRHVTLHASLDLLLFVFYTSG